jgi:hypothetical protein
VTIDGVLVLAQRRWSELLYLSIYWYMMLLVSNGRSPAMTAEPNDKQITIDVPEDRVAEFYAFYGRFLEGFPGRRGYGRGHRCGGGHGHRHAEPHAGSDAPETQTA